MIMGILGGTTIPIVEEATVTPAANSGGYPRFSISGISTDPRADVSATDDPEIPPKIMLATIFTSPSPPLMGRTMYIQKSSSLLVIPLSFISSPIKINRGMATST